MMEKIIICIGRQYGCGGRKIAKMLAEDFGCKLYDKEILNLAAKESGFSEKFFEQNDEKRGFIKSLFQNHGRNVLTDSFYRNHFSQDSLFLFQSEAISKAAEAESCVFVGRCADYVLRNNSNVVNIFITADMEDRISAVMMRHECSRENALKIINSRESSRASYYNYYTGKKWGHAESYDLCVNTSVLGLEETEEFIKNFILKRIPANNKKQEARGKKQENSL